ncbi:MAG: hypothetical protein ABIA04_03875 [Pseudomonadota bacterium]
MSAEAFIKCLDDPSEDIRIWSAIGLRKKENYTRKNLMALFERLNSKKESSQIVKDAISASIAELQAIETEGSNLENLIEENFTKITEKLNSRNPNDNIDALYDILNNKAVLNLLPKQYRSELIKYLNQILLDELVISELDEKSANELKFLNLIIDVLGTNNLYKNGLGSLKGEVIAKTLFPLLKNTIGNIRDARCLRIAVKVLDILENQASIEKPILDFILEKGLTNYSNEISNISSRILLNNKQNHETLAAELDKLIESGNVTNTRKIAILNAFKTSLNQESNTELREQKEAAWGQYNKLCVSLF